MPALLWYSVGMKTIQYTVRDVPERLDLLLRQQAKRRHKSLNFILKRALTKGMGLSDTPVEYHDLDYLAGSWVDDPEFDKAMKAFDVIDEDVWK